MFTGNCRNRNQKRDIAGHRQVRPGREARREMAAAAEQPDGPPAVIAFLLVP